MKKKQALLSDKIDGIKDPQYLKLNKDLFELFEAKEIWPDELKKLDAEFSDVMAQGGKVQTGSSVDFENAFKKRNDALKVFQASQAYKDYMVSKKEKLDSLAAKQAKYMTPEIINLKQEIDSLGTEVYSTTPR